MNIIRLAESGRLPDWLIRFGIRSLLSRRLKSRPVAGVQSQQQDLCDFVAQLKASPLAVNTDAANDQHYEVPAQFFHWVLGPRLKYSCCLYSSKSASLAEAEERMLGLTCCRAEIVDGMNVLELGCGWGALTLWMAEQYPHGKITAVSNSHGQREFIEARCREKNLSNVTVVTCDIRDFETTATFDRVVSLEMFEHLRNYELLFQRISHWLHDDGKLFFHIFCHKDTPYLFETEGPADWMGRHFFTGGMMPCDNLPLYFQRHLAIQDHWHVSGLDYARTCEDWLGNLDKHRDPIVRLFESAQSKKDARVSVQRWRMFFMACAELFRFRAGTEWFVSHYLFQNRPSVNLQPNRMESQRTNRYVTYTSPQP